MATQQLIEVLHEQAQKVSEEIEQKELAFAAQAVELSALREHVDQIETATALGVGTAANDAGKPIFSNDVSRKAEIAIRLAGNSTHSGLRLKIDASNYDHQMLRIRIDFLHRSYQLARIAFEAAGLGSIKTGGDHG